MPQNNENTTITLPVLPLRGLVAFPDMLIHFDVGRSLSIRALEEAMKDGQQIFLTAQRNIKMDAPQPEDLYEFGTICAIRQILKLPGDNIRVLVEGRSRAKVQEYTQSEPCLFAQVEMKEPDDSRISERRKLALIRTAQERFSLYAQYASRISHDVMMTVAAGGTTGYLADYIAQNISIDYAAKQELLEELNGVHRLEKVIRLLGSETEILRIEDDLQDKLRTQIDKNQKEYYLREQIKVIQGELGEQDSVSEAAEYREKIERLALNTEAKEKMLKEVARLEKMPQMSAESGVVRTWLDTVLELPWNIETNEHVNLKAAKKQLDKDHYGLEKVKERILEFLAVKMLSPQLKGQVLCLAGPPGVGKTSIAKSIAAAMNRNYARLSLGGVRDEADIRGHRKTYIGAMPGRIINGVHLAGSKNCLLLLDEIDKMSSDFHGDPSAAMLEVFDAEQNFAFRDHFVELPFDLSNVLFITTANDLSTVPRPLLDRMEVIELSSYTEEEKAEIAMKHLLPRQMEKHGLKKTNLNISADAMHLLISGYTREAGVRRLEQFLAKICRKAARMIAEGDKKKVSVTRANMESFLGTVRYKEDLVTKRDEVGIVNGLAWTSVGGELLQVEVGTMEGTGKTEITGNLGTVMQESAKAAITYVRSRAHDLAIDPMFYKDTDIHIHFPEAAIPKDGPSAGVTMATAIVSALTGAPVRHDVAMTGEVTLRGRVLPIGGLKEKTMAAYRAGIKTVIVPKDNERDLQDIDPVVQKNLTFVPAETMDTVLQTAVDFSQRPKKVDCAIAKPGEQTVTIRQ